MTVVPVLTSLTPIEFAGPTVAGDLIVEDWQQEFNGLLVGANTPYELQEMTGLTSIGPVRSGSVDRFGRHGGVAGRHYLPIKQMVGVWDIYPGDCDQEEFARLRTAAVTAFAPREDPFDFLPFVYKLPTQEKRRIYLRPLAYDVPMNIDFSLAYGRMSVRFEAVDPFVYSNTRYSSTVLPNQADEDGLDFPLEFPLDFGPAGIPGAMQVINNGNMPAYWLASITGECVGPTIEHMETGRVMSFPDLEIGPGQTLEVNSQDRSIKLNGTASRRGFLGPGSRWFELAPGLNHVRFNAQTGTTGRMNFYWRYQYWSE